VSEQRGAGSRERGAALRFASHRQLAQHAAARPPGYLLDLEPVIVRRDADGVWYDAALPAYAELCAKYRPPHSPGQAPSLNVAWQQWREHDGRWVPTGHVPPGYAADPPQFDPLPGETQHTPAFPVDDY